MKSSPATPGVFESNLFMKVMGFFLIAIGAMFCVTLLGAIIGIPAIVVGISFFSDSKYFEGKCPSCDSPVKASVIKDKVPACTCDSCKKRLVVKDKLFQVVE